MSSCRAQSPSRLDPKLRDSPSLTLMSARYHLWRPGSWITVWKLANHLVEAYHLLISWLKIWN